MQFEEVLGLSDPNEDPRQLVDPRLGDKFPLDSVFKVTNLSKMHWQCIDVLHYYLIIDYYW